MTASRETSAGRRRLGALLASNFISQTGNLLTFLAIPWFVLQTTGSATRTGFISAISILAIVPSGLLGGAFVDRLGLKAAGILSDIASGLAVAMVPLLYLTTGIEFWELALLVFLRSALAVPGQVAHRSMLQDLAASGEIRLDRANTFFQLTDRFAGIAGPVLAGTLIATIGASSVLWLDAASFAVSAAIVAFIRFGSPRAGEKVVIHLGRDIAAGLRFLRQDAVLFPLVLAFGVIGMIAEPLLSVVLPVYARDVYDSSVSLGVIFAALGAGSIAGNILYFVFAGRLPRRPYMVAAFSVRAVSFFLLVLMPPLPAVCAVVAVTAVAIEPTNPIMLTLIQERLPNEMRGRALGVVVAFVSMLRPAGIFAYGVLLDQAGLRHTLVVMAAVNAGVPFVLAWLPGLRRLEPQATPNREAITT